MPQIVRAVSVPVIAAGGIADASGVVAALELGAAAVQIGTAYLLCPETTTTPLHRDALLSPGATHTALTNVFTGRPARGIVNRLIAELGPIILRRLRFRSHSPLSWRCGRKPRVMGTTIFQPCGLARTQAAARTYRPPS